MRSLVLIPLLLACAPAMAQQPPTSTSAAATMSTAHIMTSARGEARARPDRATVMIGVQTRAATAAQAASENATKQEAVLAALRRLGLTNDELSTVEYNVYPEMRYNREGEEPKIVGYTVQNSIRADVRRIDQIGAVLDAALGAGANAINSLTFHASNIEAVRRQAIAQAMENARADAEVLARAAGGTLGRLIEASTVEVAIPIMRQSLARMDAAQAAPPTPIQPGEQEVSASVTAMWEFLPQR